MTDIPPHAYRTTDKGEYIMTETNYRILAACKANMVLMSQRFSVLTLVEIIMDMEPRIRDLTLDEERRSDRNDPSRIRKLLRREDETDAQYHFRVAKRMVGLRLYGPGRGGVTQRQSIPIGQIFDDTPPEGLRRLSPRQRTYILSNVPQTAGAEEQNDTGHHSEDSNLSLEYHGEAYNSSSENGTEEGSEEASPTRFVRPRDRPVLSGNPYEESLSEEEDRNPEQEDLILTSSDPERDNSSDERTE